jgi:ketosteroid isomerase-like protein
VRDVGPTERALLRPDGRLMPHTTNVELVHRAYDAFNRRDWEGLLALVDEEVVVESRLVAMEGAYRGHAGLRRWWDDFLGAFPDYKVEIEELRDLGDVTLGHIRGWGHSAASDTPLVDPFWQLIRWRHGKCVWWRNYSTEAEALQDLG